MHLALKLKNAEREISIGAFIKSICTQLGMSQIVLSKRSGVPQSTISRIEKGHREVNLSTLNKILEALTCDLVIAPLLYDSIDSTSRKQARKVAEKQVFYLKPMITS